MSTDQLFTPINFGEISLKHRVVMAPLTRMRAEPGDLPHALHTEYYGQRASDGGLIITEATDISPSAHGYPMVPGIYSSEQIKRWQAVTAAVHAKKGFIFSQLWHTGRISHSTMQPDGKPALAPSAIRPAGEHFDASGNTVEFETPRAMEISDIHATIADFVQAAKNAREAGFDGVEIHSANGYLLDQFLRTGSNQRTDQYGGTIENRSRLLLEVVDAVVNEIGAGRVGVRLSPWGTFNDMSDDTGINIWQYIGTELNKRGLAYLHVIEPRVDFSDDSKPLDLNAPDASANMKNFFDGPLISAGGYGYAPETARQAIAEQRADAIAFGRIFISNPDLPKRLEIGAELNKYDRSTFYGGGAEGYTDYPFLEQTQ